MAEAMAARGANVIGIDPAAEAIAAVRSYARADGLRTGNDIGVGEELPYLGHRLHVAGATCVPALPDLVRQRAIA